MSRAKSMRGSGMEDVIFAGAASRPARNFAEVSLQIDNAERLAPGTKFADIIGAIQTGRSPLVDGVQARLSVEVVLAIYEASRRGLSVKLAP